MRIVQIGLGNIGRPLAEHVGRMEASTSLTLVDRDIYEPSNICSQGALATDVGAPKATAMAGRLREIRPGLDVQAVVGDIEDAPVGLLSADAVLTALDGRRARQVVSERLAWLGARVWVDAGVDADRELIRVSVFSPGDAGGPCLQCGWSEADYAAVESRYSCLDGSGPAPTGATTMVGAIAAAIQAMELSRLMDSESVESSQLIANCAGLNGRRWRLSRSESCRFDHRRLPIEALNVSPEDCSLAELLREAALGRDWILAAPGHRFVTEACCSRCETNRRSVSLEATLVQKAAPCSDCGEPFSPRMLRTAERLGPADISGELVGAPLTGIGVRPMDVLELRDTAGNERYFGMGIRR